MVVAHSGDPTNVTPCTGADTHTHLHKLACIHTEEEKGGRERRIGGKKERERD